MCCLKSIKRARKTALKLQKNPQLSFKVILQVFPPVFHEQIELFKWSPEVGLSASEKWNNSWYRLRVRSPVAFIKIQFLGF